MYFGRRNVYEKMQTELSYSASSVFNISWIVVQDPEDFSPPFSALSSGTYIITQKVNTIQDFNSYLADKWFKSRHPTDDLERLMKCSGETTVPDFAHNDIASTIDAVFVFAGALQRLANLYCSSGDFCSDLRRVFKFQFNEVRSHPVIYKDIADNVTVKEFAEKDRRAHFNVQGEFFPNEEMELYEVTLVTGQNNFTKVFQL